MIAGGGAPEIEIAHGLLQWSQTLPGQESYCVKAYASALEVIPYTLAENAGLSPIAVVTELRRRHAQGESHVGINVRKGCITDINDDQGDFSQDWGQSFTKKKIKGTSAEIGDTVKTRVGRLKERRGIASASSKEGYGKLRDYRNRSEFVGFSKRKDTYGGFRRRDSNKKIRSRTESSFKVYHSCLLTDDSTKNQRWKSNRSRTDTLGKRDLSTPLQIDKDEATISNGGYLSDNAIKYSSKKKRYMLLIVWKLNG
eukprot:g15523.t1